MKFSKVAILSLFLISIVANAQQNTANLKKAMSENDFIEASKYALAASKEAKDSKNLEVIVMCGDAYLNIENLDSAMYFYKFANDIKSYKPFIMRKIGKVNILKGQIKEAIKILKDAISEDKKDQASYLSLADAYIADKNMKDAEVTINQAKKLNDKNPDIFITLGDMYFEQGVYELSQSNYNEALTLNPSLLTARERLATSYYWLGSREPIGSELANEYYSNCLKEWNEVIKQDPKNSKAYFEIGKIKFWSYNFKEAAPALYQYYKLRPDGKLARWFLAQSLVETKQFDSALVHLKYSSENIDTVRIKAKLLLARCYYDTKNYNLTTGAYASLTKDTTLSIADYRRFAFSYLLSGDTISSINTFKETISKYPNDACGIEDAVGRLLFTAKKYNDALYFLDMRYSNQTCKVNGVDSTASKTTYYIGASHFFLQNQDSAIYYLDLSNKLDSNQVQTYNFIADSYAQKKDLDKSKIYFNIALDKALSDTLKYKQTINGIFGKLSQMEFEAKDFKKLTVVAKRWTEATPNSPTSWLYLAFSYHSSGDSKRACESYKKVLEIDPNNKSALDNKKKVCD
ncbi:MAG: tetratricopeptide repeat protein [Candidatus Kapabacteria bacterium]|nr:tetratricopeptide repeat protein [Candidatus Kapabacteria bacterium]